MTRIRDEGFFDITSHEVLHGNDVQCRIRRGVLYYAGRRHKNGTLQDGVASFYIDNVPAQRMYYVADGTSFATIARSDSTRTQSFRSKLTRSKSDRVRT